MGWFTTSIEFSANDAYDRSKTRVATIYQQAHSKLWHTDESPDAGQQQAQLADETSHEAGLSPEDREVFEDLTQEQMGLWMADLEHRERLELLGNDAFIQEYWPKARTGIKDNETLKTKFGLNEEQHTKEGPNGEACLHHEHLGPITTVPYTPEVTETTGRSATRDEKGVGELSPGGQGKIRGETAEGETAKAERTEKRQGTVDVCKNDPNSCPTSLNAFYWESERRSVSVGKKSNSSISKQFETNPTGYLDAGAEEKADTAVESEDDTMKESPSGDRSGTADTQNSDDDGLMNYDEGTEERKHPTTGDDSTTTASNEVTEPSPEQAEENTGETAKTDANADAGSAASDQTQQASDTAANQPSSSDTEENSQSHTQDSDDAGLMNYDEGTEERKRRTNGHDSTDTSNNVEKNRDKSADEGTDLDDSGMSL